MNETVLIVDDNRLILESAKDLLTGRGLTILTANNAEEALALFRQREIEIVVSDNCMPGMDGLEFLTSLRELSPDTVKILMSAYADLASALAAINRSEVFRYILKPLQDEELVNAVEEGIKRYRLNLSMRIEDENVLRSLAQTLELKDPSTKGHCDRVAVYALMIAEALQIPKETQRQIKYGSWLHDCGKIGISEIILNGNGRLTDEEYETMKKHTLWGAEVAAKANLSDLARNIILHHHERFDGTGYPSGIGGTEIPQEARIVAVADVYDALTMDRPYRTGYSHADAIELLRTMRGNALEPELVDIFLTIIKKTLSLPHEVSYTAGATTVAVG